MFDIFNDNLNLLFVLFAATFASATTESGKRSQVFAGEGSDKIEQNPA